jgi:hypothetical protein
MLGRWKWRIRCCHLVELLVEGTAGVLIETKWTNKLQKIEERNSQCKS